MGPSKEFGRLSHQLPAIMLGILRFDPILVHTHSPSSFPSLALDQPPFPKRSSQAFPKLGTGHVATFIVCN